jgi:transposase
MRRVLQKKVNEDNLRRELDDISDLGLLLQHLHHGRLQDRNRAIVALASRRQIPKQTICDFLGVSKGFVRKYKDKFDSGGAKIMFASQTKSNRKIDNGDLKSAVFTLLHQPPTNHGINRTSWTKALLCQAFKANGRPVGAALVGKMIKEAGYKWRKAKIVLTSNDPTYKEKLACIRSILSSLHPPFFITKGMLRPQGGPYFLNIEANPPGVVPCPEGDLPPGDLARGRCAVEGLQVKERAQEPGPVEALLFQRQGRAGGGAVASGDADEGGGGAGLPLSALLAGGEAALLVTSALASSSGRKGNKYRALASTYCVNRSRNIPAKALSGFLSICSSARAPAITLRLVSSFLASLLFLASMALI